MLVVIFGGVTDQCLGLLAVQCRPSATQQLTLTLTNTQLTLF